MPRIRTLNIELTLEPLMIWARRLAVRYGRGKSETMRMLSDDRHSDCERSPLNIVLFCDRFKLTR